MGTSNDGIKICLLVLVAPILFTSSLLAQQQGKLKKQFKENPGQALKQLQKGSLDQKKKFADQLFELYQGSDWTLALEAGELLQSVGQQAPETVLPILVRRLKTARNEKSQTDQLRIIRLLGKIGVARKSVVNQLINALKSDEVALQRSALNVIAELGSDASRAVPQMKQFLDHPSPLMRRAAFSALKQCAEGQELVDALGPALLSRDPYIRQSTLDLLKQTDTNLKAVVNPLFQLVQDKGREKSERRDALKLIGRAGKAASGLSDKLINFGRTDAPVPMRSTIQQTLNQIKNENAAPSVKPISVSCREGKTVRITFQADDPDDLSEGLKAIIARKPDEGSFTREGKRTLTYHSKQGVTGNISFKWRMKDPTSKSTPAKGTIRIKPDTAAPIVRSARVVDAKRKHIRIHMNEPVKAASAKKLEHYRLKGAKIKNAELIQEGYVIRLSTDKLKPETSYDVTVSGLADRSSNGNIMTSDVTLPVAQEVADRNGLLLLSRTNGNTNDGSGHDRQGTLKDGANLLNDRGKGGVVQFSGQSGNKKNALSFGKLKPLQNAKTFTVGFWFRREEDLPADSNHGTSNIMFSQGGDGSNDNLEIGTDGENVEVYLDTESGGGMDSWNGDVQDNTWNHLALSFDSSRDREAWLYLNGERIKKWSKEGRLRKAVAPVTIGNTFHKESPFSGWMDEVCVYDRALNKKQIEALKGNPPYQRGKEPYRSEQLVLLAPGDGNAEDRSGYRRHGTTSGNVKIPETLGKEGAFSFVADKKKEGTVQFPVGKALSEARNMSVSFWVRRRVDQGQNTNPTSSPYLFRYGTTDNTDIVGVNVSNSALSVLLHTDQGQITVSKKWQGAIRDGRWYHLTFVYSGEQQEARLYLDGEKEATWTTPGTKLKQVKKDGAVTLGRTAKAETFFSGYIDELMIYSRSLGADEIQTVKGDRPHSRQDVLLLARGDGDATDQSGNGRTGSMTDGAGFAPDAGINGAYRFRGTKGDQKNAVNFGPIDPLQEADAFTVAFWFRRRKNLNGTTNHGTGNVLFSQGSDNDNDNLEIGTNGSNIDLFMQTPTHNGKKSWDGSIENETWYHLALTYDADREKGAWLYLNGTVVKKWAAWNKPLTSASSPVTIGNTFHVETPFKGMMDEVFVYGRTLHTNEIRTIMEKQ